MTSRTGHAAGERTGLLDWTADPRPDRGLRFRRADGEWERVPYTDLADLWERAAVDGTPVRDIVGDDPADFADTFAKAYAGREWIDKERGRFTAAIDKAAGSQAAGEEH